MSTTALCFLFLHKNMCCGYLLEALGQGTANEYHSICFHGEIKQIQHFLVEQKKNNNNKNILSELCFLVGAHVITLSTIRTNSADGKSTDWQIILFLSFPRL